MLDLGSGVGVTAQLFSSLGYDVTLADVSSPLLTFAQWRLEQRGVKADYIQLPAEFPDASYDLITALDVMAHVPDVAETARRLHRSLRRGGLFVANFDVRRRSRRNAWHLYEDDLPLRWAVQKAGFTPVTLIDGILWIYRADSPTGLAWRLRTALAWVRLASPPARGLRQIRRAFARLVLVVASRIVGRQTSENDAAP
jgi:SAM-dependent methyltransferase